MAEEKSLSTKDLFLLMTGIFKLKSSPPRDKDTPGEKYWLDDKGALRESEWNDISLASPSVAWECVPHRDWLISKIVANITSNKHDFTTLSDSEPLLYSMDALTKEFKPDQTTASDAIKKAVVNAKATYKRSFLTALTVGLSKSLSGTREVFVAGAGIRRRTSVWRIGADNEVLQADLEFFMPFYIIPQSGKLTHLTITLQDILERDVNKLKMDPPKNEFPGARSINAGILIKYENGYPIGQDSKGKHLSAARFNFRIPINSITSDSEGELATSFGTPEVTAQKRYYAPPESKQPGWEKFDDWEKFIKEFCDTPNASELLSAPIGPLLLETVDDDSSIKDIILNKKKRDELKEGWKEAKEDLQEAAQLLKGLWEGNAPKGGPKPEKLQPSSSTRTLGGLLKSLGFLDEEDDKFSLEIEEGLSVWDVFNRMLAELDGFPLYIKGIDPKGDKETRIAVTLASQKEPGNDRRQFFGLAGLAYNIAIKTASKEDAEAKGTDGDSDKPLIVLDDDNFTEDDWVMLSDDEDEQEEAEGGGEQGKPENEDKKKSAIDIRLQLGKWFDGETIEDNWFRRLLPPADILKKKGIKQRVPLPGIRILPVRRTHAENNEKASFSITPRVDLLSLGVDIKGTTKKGLTFLKAKKGPLAYFGLGGVEARIALLMSAERVTFGIGVKLNKLRLSLAPKEEDDEKKKDEITGPLQELLEEGWEEVPNPEPEERKPNTRLGAKKIDKFSISAGYLTPLFEGGSHMLDVQLYDKKGNRGKMIYIPIDRRASNLYLKHIGVGLKGLENVELGKGLSDSARLTLSLTGGLRFSAFELGLIGAKVSFPLRNPRAFELSLEGLDVSIKIGDAIISGSFLKSGYEYGGSLSIDLPKFSIGAMGYYGNLKLFSMQTSPKIELTLQMRRMPDELLAELKKNNLTPAAERPVMRGNLPDEWILTTADGKQYPIVKIDDELIVLSPDKSFFVYGTASMASGAGLRAGPIEFTGFALGFGINRQIKIPPVEKVAEFPLVKIVMGKGGYQKPSLNPSNDLRDQTSKAEDPVTMLEKMKDSLPAKPDQYFICAGVRFTIATAVDCFGLIIVQFGKEFELSLLGLARFRQPRDLSLNAICYIEMQLLMTIKPSEGCFKLQALLTNNSWIINKDCKLTGGFAIYAWFDGKHKGEYVVTFGGYHPRFQRPSHYPIVPRIGLNWPVNENLSIKGEVYLAFTTSCCMIGAKMEAIFRSGRISAWFTAYLDAIVHYSPLFFEVDIGISLRAEVSFTIKTFSATLGVSLKMWGPPTGGIAHIDLVVISFDIPFGTNREDAKPKRLKDWNEFCQNFITPDVTSGSAKPTIDKPADAIPITQPNLLSGRSNQNNPPGQQQATAPWRVRGDQLELSASAAVPITALNVGRVKTNSPPEGVQNRTSTGKPLQVAKPVALESAGLRTKKFNDKLGVHPIGKALESTLNVTIVCDDGSQAQPVDLKGWTIEEETSSMPAALWDAAQPEPKGPSDPSAKLIPDCITGIKRLKPPAGKLGPQAAPSEITWHEITRVVVSKSGASQEITSATRSRNVQAAVASKQAEQKQIVEALTEAGFNLAWKSGQTEIRFRELQADPLAGAVATGA